MPRHHLAALFVSALAGTATAQPAAPVRAYESHEHGFRIDGIDGWELRPDREDGRFILRIRPAGSRGTSEAVIRVSPDAGSDSAAVREQLLRRARRDPKVTASEPLDGRLGEHASAALRFRYAGPGTGGVVVQQDCLVAGGLRYVMQCHAPAEEWSRRSEDFARLRASFRLLEAGRDVLYQRRLRALADRCGSELAWAESWAQAAARAEAEGKLVLVVVRRYPGFNLPDVTQRTVFMDCDVVELVGARFVPLRFTPDMEAPFKTQRRYGLSATTFGFGILVVTPEGDVVRETASEHPRAVYEFLVDAVERLARHPPAPDGVDPVDWALRSGALSQAAELLRRGTSAAAHRRRADLFRRQRHAAAALDAVAAARALGADDLALALTEVVVRLRSGAAAEAQAALAAWTARHPDARSPELLFWQGVCASQSAVPRQAAVADAWSRLIAAHPDSRWAWLAAALLQSGARPRVAWPPADALDALRTPDPQPLPEAEVAAAEAAGVAFLLARQRADGSWTSPSEVVNPIADAPNPFTDAITAICGRCLLQRGGTAERAAAERALAFVLASERRARPERRSYMDYSVWSRTFVLWFLADCKEAGIGDGALGEVMQRLVRQLGDRQLPTGGWSYFVTGDLDANGSASQSISFVTAPVLLALLRAQGEGVRVQEDVLARGLDCLAKMRRATGAFGYFLHGDGRVTATGVAGAAGRGPVCELALLRGGRGDADRLRRSLETFQRFRAGIAKEVGKVLMHAGPEGQGCHYPMFDYAFAALALRELPAEDRARHRRWLTELILATRSEEGAFRDAQFNGWAYGTAMALTALRALRTE